MSPIAFQSIHPSILVAKELHSPLALPNGTTMEVLTFCQNPSNIQGVIQSLLQKIQKTIDDSPQTPYSSTQYRKDLEPFSKLAGKIQRHACIIHQHATKFGRNSFQILDNNTIKDSEDCEKMAEILNKTFHELTKQYIQIDTQLSKTGWKNIGDYQVVILPRAINR